MFLNLFTGCGGSDKYLGITPKNFVENFNKQLKPLSEALKMNLAKYKITSEKQDNDGNIFYQLKNSRCNVTGKVKDSNLEFIGIDSTALDDVVSVAMTAGYSIPKTVKIKNLNKQIVIILTNAYEQSGNRITKTLNGVRLGAIYTGGMYMFFIDSGE